MSPYIRYPADQDDLMTDVDDVYQETETEGCEGYPDFSSVLGWNAKYLSQQWHPVDNICLADESAPLTAAIREKLRETESTLRELQLIVSEAAMLNGRLGHGAAEMYCLQGLDYITADLKEVLDVLKGRKGQRKRGTDDSRGRAKRMKVSEPFSSPSRGEASIDKGSATAKKIITRSPSPGRAVRCELIRAGLLDPDYEINQKVQKAIQEHAHLQVGVGTVKYVDPEDRPWPADAPFSPRWPQRGYCDASDGQLEWFDFGGSSAEVSPMPRREQGESRVADKPMGESQGQMIDDDDDEHYRKKGYTQGRYTDSHEDARVRSDAYEAARQQYDWQRERRHNDLQRQLRNEALLGRQAAPRGRSASPPVAMECEVTRQRSPLPEIGSGIAMAEKQKKEGPSGKQKPSKGDHAGVKQI